MEQDDIDFEMLPEVLDEVREHLPSLEQDLHHLVQTPGDADLLASAFRHMHTIKGDFSYCRATHVVDFVHQLEGVMQSLRARTFDCSAQVAEALLQSIDQLTDMMQDLVECRPFDEVRYQSLTRLIIQLANAGSQDNADNAARDILLAVHGLLPEMAAIPISPASYARALALGKQLAAALGERFPPWRQREVFQLRVAQALNQQYRPPGDARSLELAVYWHDVGLLAAPDRFLSSPPTWKSDDWPAYCAHPERAATWLLEVAPDCSEAVRIIREHHLWANGAGFPQSPDRHPPCAGAQILACIDLVYERVAGLSGEEFRRSVLKAVFDVNGGLDNRFDAALINAFQSVAREHLAEI